MPMVIRLFDFWWYYYWRSDVWPIVILLRNFSPKWKLVHGYNEFSLNWEHFCFGFSGYFCINLHRTAYDSCLRPYRPLRLTGDYYLVWIVFRLVGLNSCWIIYGKKNCPYLKSRQKSSDLNLEFLEINFVCVLSATELSHFACLLRLNMWLITG